MKKSQIKEIVNEEVESFQRDPQSFSKHSYYHACLKEAVNIFMNNNPVKNKFQASKAKKQLNEDILRALVEVLEER